MWHNDVVVIDDIPAAYADCFAVKTNKFDMTQNWQEFAGNFLLKAFVQVNMCKIL